MNKIQSSIIGKNKITAKKNFIWNMIGSGVYSAISMMLSVCVIRIVGENTGGIFSIAVTVSQMMLYIAYFEQRTYQVTDTEQKYEFSQYHGAKIVVCFFMLICSLMYILVIKRYTIEKAEIIFLMCVYRMIDGYADLYEGQFQLDGHLYLAGKSMAFRSIISALAFLIMLVMTKNMRISLYVAVGIAVVTLIIFDLEVAKVYHSIKPSFDVKKILAILKACAPLFVGSFLWVYILSASRIAVDANMDNNYTAYYQMLFLPVSIINLFATFFFRPELTILSELYDKNNLREFAYRIKVLLAMIAIFTVMVMGGAYLLGIQVLTFISGCDLTAYRLLLVLLMLAGGINAGSFFLYYILTIMRKPKQILFGYISTALLTFGMSNLFTKIWGIEGAGISFLVSVFYLFLVFYFCYLIDVKSKRNDGLGVT